MSRTVVNMRIRSDALEEIDAQAKAWDLSRTEYVTRAALGQLTPGPLTTDQRVNQIEERLVRVEDAVFNSASY